MFFLNNINLVEDAERNDGSIRRPYFMSKELMQILTWDHMKICRHSGVLQFNQYE